MSEHYCEFDHNLDEPCGKPAVGETDNGYGHGSFPYCEEHRPAK